MKKNVWIFNHYATTSYFENGGRHYWFASQLIAAGYQPTIFCANTLHNSKKFVDLKGHRYIKLMKNNVPFVFVKAFPYYKNGMERVRNIYSFYRGIFKVAQDYIKLSKETPDIIIASSVHPLTCIAGIKISKKLKIPCVVEIRDLWPETFISMGILKEKNMIAKVLYRIEKNIYERADTIIFTMEGGPNYIRDKKWDIGHGGSVSLDKVYYINNGIHLEEFYNNAERHPCLDDDMNDGHIFKFVYTGSIRRVNNIDKLLDAAKILKSSPNIRFFLWGEGDEVEKIVKRILDENIKNMVYKGTVSKSQIPGILIKSDVNIKHTRYMPVHRYGTSMNKEFEYLAAGKPILSTTDSGCSIIKKWNCGVEVREATADAIADACLSLYNLSEKERGLLGDNAKRISRQFDFKKLTETLIHILEATGRR